MDPTCCLEALHDTWSFPRSVPDSILASLTTTLSTYFSGTHKFPLTLAPLSFLSFRRWRYWASLCPQLCVLQANCPERSPNNLARVVNRVNRLASVPGLSAFEPFDSSH